MLVDKMSNSSQIQLGVVDQLIREDCRDTLDFTVNKIGGLPDYLPNKHFNLKQCPSCSNKMLLVTQFYCPLENSMYHRVFYVMACINKLCWNKSSSWCVYRSQSMDKDYERVQKHEDQTMSNDWEMNNEWNSNDWNGLNDTNNWDIDVDKMENMLTSGLESMNISQTMNDHNNNTNNSCLSSSASCNSLVDSNANENSSERNEYFNKWKQNLINETYIDSNHAQFQSYYLNVINKASIIQSNGKQKIKLNEYDYDRDDDSRVKTSGITKNEGYEKANLRHGDRIFYKFRKQIDDCPSQVIRYTSADNVEPLFIKKHDDFNSHLECNHCSSPCKFEFQLMPALVNYLKPFKNIDCKENLLEFGVVIVYTCSKSCWNELEDTFKSECVYVQSDPDDKLFN